MLLQQRKIFLFISGLILILFCLIFFSFRQEFFLEKYFSLKEKKEVLQIKQDFLNKKSIQEKQKLQVLNREVDVLSNQISSLIYKGNIANDSITNWFSQGPDVSLKLQDSLQIMETELEQNERQVDSLNLLFTDQSNSLLQKLKTIDKQNMDIKLAGVHIKIVEKSIFMVQFQLLFYAFIMLGGLIWGIILLAKSYHKS